MAELYFFVSKDKVQDVVDCGLKLSEWYDREITLPETTGSRKVLKAFLNPRDDREKFKDDDYKCLRLDVDLDYCKVADWSLYRIGQDEPYLMQKYYDSIIPLKNYRFGTYREPEILVLTSVLPEYIEVTGIALDIPLLYESSEAIYLVNLMQKHEELYKDSGNHLLYAFFTYLEARGQVIRYEDKEKKCAVFFAKDSDEYSVLKIP
ncbi:MAG: hypothetical protein GX227_07750 [Clostridiaceae bacterium]|jgi:hypothetical protein|nr:hypothetical protein [Clostridiaceae bacterium]